MLFLERQGSLPCRRTPSGRHIPRGHQLPFRKGCLRAAFFVCRPRVQRAALRRRPPVVEAEEEIAQRPAAAERPPPLRAVVRAVVEEVAALAQRAEVPKAAVAGGVVEVGGGEHGAGRAQRHGFHEVGPAGGAVAPIASGAGALVEPAVVGQAAQGRLVGPAAALAAPAGAVEAHALAQLSPLRRIERAQLAADRHAANLGTSEADVNRPRSPFRSGAARSGSDLPAPEKQPIQASRERPCGPAHRR